MVVTVLPQSDDPAPGFGVPTLWLASRSPRRAELLRAAGFAFQAFDPPYDDPADPNCVTAAPGGAGRARWLAERKAASVSRRDLPRGAVVLTADTLVVAPDGGLLGTPETPEQARAVLSRLCGAAHVVATGVCLRRGGEDASSFLVTARVTWGAVDWGRIERYVAGGQWRGKAGGYNLVERQRDGWPVTVEGDRAAVMGLPVAALGPRLAALGIVPVEERRVAGVVAPAPPVADGKDGGAHG